MPSTFGKCQREISPVNSKGICALYKEKTDDLRAAGLRQRKILKSLFVSVDSMKDMLAVLISDKEEKGD